MKITELLSQFDVSGRLVLAQPFGNGNINDTYLAVYRNTFDETQVILQRVNRKVFKKPEDIMSNMHVLCDHCHRKLELEADRSDRVWQMPRIVQTKDGRDFVRDGKGDVWRVITRVLSAHAYDTAQSPEEALEKKLTREAVRRGLAQLPEDARQILLLREIQGLSYEEIAAALSIEVGTVKSRIFRARKRLCTFLIEDGNIPDFTASGKMKGGEKQ